MTIARAALDQAARRRRFGRPFAPPEAVQWGALSVITGDTWFGVPERGRATIRVERPDPQHEHGIALRAGGQKTLFWPGPDAEEFTVDYAAPKGALHLWNVHLYRHPRGTSVRQWDGDAGMLVTANGDGSRSYACNHADTTPPAFTDLRFTVAVT